MFVFYVVSYIARKLGQALQAHNPREAGFIPPYTSSECCLAPHPGQGYDSSPNSTGAVTHPSTIQCTGPSLLNFCDLMGTGVANELGHQYDVIVCPKQIIGNF